MSTPATVVSFGENLAVKIAAPQTSDGAMDNITQAAEKDIPEARARLKEWLDTALQNLDTQYEMEKARLLAQHATVDADLHKDQEMIAAYKINAVAAMDKFLTACNEAAIRTVELVPAAAARTVPTQVERHVSEQERPPKFLEHPIRVRRPATAVNQPLVALVILAASLLTLLGAGMVGAWEHKPTITAANGPAVGWRQDQ